MAYRKNPVPGLFEIYEKRVFLTFSLFGFLAIFNDSPLTGRENKKVRKFYKKKFIKKTRASPPSPAGGEGGDPPFRAQPGIKSTPKIAIAAEKKRE